MGYPSVPENDPVARRRFFWARNQRIQEPGSEPLTEEQLDQREKDFQEQRAKILAKGRWNAKED